MDYFDIIYMTDCIQ